MVDDIRREIVHHFTEIGQAVHSATIATPLVELFSALLNSLTVSRDAGESVVPVAEWLMHRTCLTLLLE
jgi:hypothetical protein